jgi:valyl-tRNA synthetase
VSELAKAYEHKDVEPKWYAFWEEGGYFHAPDDLKGKKPYCIVIPPPNVTGALHMGHGLNNTLQDVLIRYKRMDGFAALWQPGTDHAGIATQNVVERDLLKTEGKRRQQIGREALTQRIWKWREEYGDRILTQLKSLGASCDWERTRFTLDEGLSKAVRECFVRLYDEGLIYRGKYIVNWCPRCHTALADDEVDHEDEKGHLWHIKYPLRDPRPGTRDPKYIVVATTRPETMLGDTAVAVNPKDERYAHLVGQMIELPETGRHIPIVADDFVDASFGTGAVKVTPAHDPNDFQIGERHNLPRINIMNEDATMSDEAPEKYRGLSRDDCRKKLVDELEKQGLLEKIEDHAHAVGHCYRCKETIEPWLSDQWFVKMRPLAEKAIQASEEGKVTFHPERWNQFYLQWLENARDWCISRQIWWGHRIPVWYCQSRDRGPGTGDQRPGTGDRDTQAGSRVPGSRSQSTCPPIVSRETPTRCPKCGGTKLVQDEDVLDTWFSSALWPFSTLGWPEKTPTLEAYYPTSTLVTDRGIIYFWVARMVMMGLKLMGKVPFSDVYIHGTILDEQGRKMSKSLGNGIDPLDVIEKYGADAMRFSLMVLSTEGQDLKLSESKFEMGRNFCNKLWNAARFAMMHLEDAPDAAPAETDLNLADRWILNRLAEATDAARDALDGFRFSVAAQTLYQFVWNDFCDWYLEAAKLHLSGRDQRPGTGDRDKERAATQHTLRRVLSDTLALLHPFLPFITEELNSHLNTGADPLIVSQYPERTDVPHTEAARIFEATIKEPVEAIRNIRGESNVDPKKRIPVAITSFSDKALSVAAKAAPQYVEYMAKVDEILAVPSGSEPESAKKAATNVTASQTTYIPYAGLIDIAAEKARLEKEIAKAEGEIAATEKKLANKSFTDRAPKEIVEREEKKKAEAAERLEKLQKALVALA